MLVRLLVLLELGNHDLHEVVHCAEAPRVWRCVLYSLFISDYVVVKRPQVLELADDLGPVTVNLAHGVPLHGEVDQRWETPNLAKVFPLRDQVVV